MTRPRPSYEFGASEFPLVHQTIGDNFREITERFPDCECVVSRHQQARFTYREFDVLTDQLAKGLLRLGIRRGDHVAIWAINRWEWVAVQFATAKTGAVLVNINPAYRTHELKYALEQSESSTIVLMESYKSSQYREMLLDICPEIAVAEPGRVQSAALPHLKNVVLIDGEAPGMYSFMRVLADGAHGSDAELAAIAPELDPDDPINIQYTSGTTGFPKGVVLSHFNILNNAQHVAHVLGMTHVDRLLIQVPFYHCFGMVLSCLGCATQGATMVIPSPTFDPLPVMQAITDEKCTVIYGVPTMFLTLLTHPDFGAYDFRSLRTGIMAGAPCPIETMKDLIARMYMREVVIAYGQTEVSPVATLTRRDDPLERRVGTVGRVLPMQEIKVIDPATAKTVPRGVPGEICFRGYQVMRGYYRNPAATAEAIDAGRWLHSGDLGVMDEQGYLKITGRLKEMVIRGGENLYPREIEEFLRTHPGVLDVYVVGVPDLKYGEELMAWVLPRDGETLTAEALREFCKGKITHFKVPRYWKFVRAATDFPMTVTGKIQKFRMKEIAIDELNLHAAASVKTA